MGERPLKRDRKCPDCCATIMKMYSPENLTGSPEKKPEKRRSFLPAPKSYSSKLPTYEDRAPKTSSSRIPSYDGQQSDPYPPKQYSYEDKTPKTQPIAIPKPSPSQISTPETSQADTYEFFIGDRVRIGGLKTGTLLYFGTIHVAPGLWCGIALDEADGTHDGLVSDVRYFTCRKKHGIFAPVDKVSHIDAKKVQVSEIVERPPKVSEFRGRTKVCATDPLRDYSYHDRSSEYIDKEEEEDGIPGLDEDGIIHDDDTEFIDRPRHKRRLPKLPKSSHGVSRLHYLRQEIAELDRGGDTIVDEAAEKLKMIAEDEYNENDELEDVIKPFHMQEEKFESPEPQLSAGGSSGAGSDSWSLSSKDVLEMCNGSGKEYFNITFDGESESKTSTQEPSEESPSPEFIFDQEMIEDGEFSSQPMNISRDSSLGLLTSLTLEKGELLFDLVDKDEEDIDRMASQETLEAMSVENMHTPEKLESLEQSVDFDDVSSSTPYGVQENRGVHIEKLNSTFTKTVESSHIGDKCLNSTFTMDNKSSQQDSANVLNNTFTVSEKDTQHNKTQAVGVMKPDIQGKGSMVDSGISMRGSMSESGLAMKGSMAESSVSVKGSLTDSSVSSNSMKHSMADSGISCRNSMIDSGFSGRTVTVYNVQGGDNEFKGEVIAKELKQKDLLDGSGLDDQKLMSDLKHGHERRERPISFMSTTSADTGYVPDTDSELGTLTLNSPNEWMEKGYHGNLEQLPEMTSIQRNLIEDFQDAKKSGHIPVESDSDIGLLTGDTDNEGNERPEVVLPVQPGETNLSGVEMETAESEDEITQVEDIKNQNVTVTLDDKLNGTYTTESEKAGLESTFTVADSEEKAGEQSQDTTDGSLDENQVPIVTVVIEDKENGEEKDKDEDESIDSKLENEKVGEKSGKVKTPKKKKFNVVKDFKKPNTTNVVSKLSEYLKSPLPVKPKEDKNNTEEAKNKRNSLKGKIDLKGSKLESKVNEEKKVEEKKEKEVIEKEPVKKVKRTPPKSKWDSIMSQIDNKKDEEKVKPKAEVKSKLAELLKAPPPPVPKKEVEKPKNKWDAIMSQIDSKKDDEKHKPKTEVKSKLAEMLKAPPPAPPKKDTEKPKRKITRAIPDYSKVQSSLKYTPAPKPNKDESPNRSKTESPNRSKTDSPKRKSSASRKDSLSRKSESPNRLKSESPAILKDELSSQEKLDTGQDDAKDLTVETDKNRHVSGDSVFRHEIRDGALHIDLAETLERRSSAVGTGSGVSSIQSSRTDLSTTGAEDEGSGVFKVPSKKAPISRAVSQPLERRESIRSVSEASEDGAQVTGKENEEKKPRRKSSLVPPTNSPGGGPKIVKPVVRRQVSAPLPNNDHMTKPSVFTNQAPANSPTRKGRERTLDEVVNHFDPESDTEDVFEEAEEEFLVNAPLARPEEFDQNRNKTSKSKTTVKAVKPAEPVPADIHSKEVQRLEALCEERTKQLKMVQLHLQNSNTAFDGMSTVVKYLAHDLDAFSCPKLLEETKSLNEQLVDEKIQTASLEKKRSNLEELIKQLKEQHKEYINNLETEQEQSINDQRTTLVSERIEAVKQVEEKCATEIVNLKKSHEAQVYHLQHEMTLTVDKLNTSHKDEIKALQRKQEHQMEELHKQHQDKLEDITQRFDSIKLTLSEKVESLKSECDRFRDRARLCEDALQRDSDYKVQLAIAPYKNLPQEIESLKTVLEMRNEEILKLRNQNTELAKKLEELPVAQEKIIALQQKKENLEAIISMKTDHEKTLHEKCQNLMKKYDKESRANKRLSMEYEELMWKLSESFSEATEMGSQEALFYKKLGMSPTGTDSPEFGRKLRTPSGSDVNSPSRSPAYRRSTSSSGDDEKRFKRRSGTYLLDKNRGDMTRSWSPATLSSSSPSRSKSSAHDRMTQSWCEADVFESPESETDQVIMRHKSGRRKRTVSEQDSEHNRVEQDFSIEISVSPRQSKEHLDKSDNSETVNSNGITAENIASTLPSDTTEFPTRSGRETVTLTEGENVFKEKTSPNVSQQNGTEPVTVKVSDNQSNIHQTDSAKLPTQTVSCPPSLIPTRQSSDTSRSLEASTKSQDTPDSQSRLRKPTTRSVKESVV